MLTGGGGITLDLQPSVTIYIADSLAFCCTYVRQQQKAGIVWIYKVS